MDLARSARAHAGHGTRRARAQAVSLSRGSSRAARTCSARSLRGRRQQVVAAIDGVSRELHNTRAAYRKYYVNPLVLEAFEEGSLAQALASARTSARATRGLSARERELIAFLESATRVRRRRAG